MTEREEFEQWFDCSRWDSDDESGYGYSVAWDTWQAVTAKSATRIAELEREIAEVRETLAHTDMGSLPNDWTLQQVAEARIDDMIKLREQVRDTCMRAEKAADEAIARAERLKAERLKAAIRSLEGVRDP